MTEKTFSAPQMSCGHCKAAVEEGLSKLAGVERSNADPQTGLVEVRYDEGRVSVEDLLGAIGQAGYDAVEA